MYLLLDSDITPFELQSNTSLKDFIWVDFYLLPSIRFNIIEKLFKPNIKLYSIYKGIFWDHILCPHRTIIENLIKVAN